MTISFMSFPVPPSNNRYYRRSGHHTHISIQGRAYKKTVCEIVAEFYPIKFGIHPVRVHIDYWPPTRRKSDLDNQFKAILDSLTAAGVWDDDSQIDELSIARKPVMKSGKIVVTVEVIYG
jgi:crossover junction endodeoxyribonuclease RusA